MPFIQRIVDPIYVSRHVTNVTDVDFNLESTLDCLTDVMNVALVNVIRQLLSLRQHASSMFEALKEESSYIKDRLNALDKRVVTLTNKAQTLTLDFHLYESHQTYVEAEQEIVSRDRRPAAIRDLYSACLRPPDLSSLDKFRDDGVSCMKLYSNPSYFFDLWYSQVQELVAKERSKGHRHNKQLHTKKREQHVRKVAVHADYHAHVDKGRIQGMGASKDKPGAIEHSAHRKEMKKKKKKNKHDELSKEEAHGKKGKKRKESKAEVKPETPTKAENDDTIQQSTNENLEAPQFEDVPLPPAPLMEPNAGDDSIKAESQNEPLPLATVTSGQKSTAKPYVDHNVSLAVDIKGTAGNEDGSTVKDRSEADGNVNRRVLQTPWSVAGQVSYKLTNRTSRVLCAIASNSQPDDVENCLSVNRMFISGLPLPPPPSFLLNDTIAEDDEQGLDDIIPPPPEPLYVINDENFPKAPELDNSDILDISNIPPPIFEPLPTDERLEDAPKGNINTSVAFPPPPPIRSESQGFTSGKYQGNIVSNKRQSLKSPPPPPPQRSDSKVTTGIKRPSIQPPPPPPLRADENAKPVPPPGGKVSTGSTPIASPPQPPPPPPPLMDALAVRQDKPGALRGRRDLVASTFFELSDKAPPASKSSGRPNMLALLTDIRSGKKLLNHVGAPEPSVASRKRCGGGVQAAMMAMIDVRRHAIGSSDESSSSSSSENDWDSES